MLEKLQYNAYQWQLRGDFKIIAFLQGLQSGYTRHSCFLCLWNGRDDVNHFLKSEWPMRTTSIPGIDNVVNPQLVPAQKILMPPLHIKLGLVKQFFKSLDKDGDVLRETKKAFPYLSRAKIEAGVFTGPQIRQLFKNKDIEEAMSLLQLKAWISLQEVVANFLGNHRSDDYKSIISKMIDSFHAIHCRMSLKLHMLHSYLDFFQ